MRGLAKIAKQSSDKVESTKRIHTMSHSYPNRARFYVGYNYPLREVFKSVYDPTEKMFPQYKAVVGPFRTKRSAMFMRDCGYNNPHCQTVSQAEKLSKTHQHFDGVWVKITSPAIKECV